jgi:hypothetical protein
MVHTISILAAFAVTGFGVVAANGFNPCVMNDKKGR